INAFLGVTSTVPATDGSSSFRSPERAIILTRNRPLSRRLLFRRLGTGRVARASYGVHVPRITYTYTYTMPVDHVHDVVQVRARVAYTYTRPLEIRVR